MSNQLCGILERVGKSWPMPLEFDDWEVIPFDDLHPGDRLRFPELAELSILRLPVVTSYGRMFNDQYRQGSNRSDYCLPAHARCCGCGYLAVQDVTIIAGEPYEKVWSFPRMCVWCGGTWEQNARRRWTRW